jgi:RimJ/RimL family protein N-acetyltransferase
VGVDHADLDRTWTDGVVTIRRQHPDDLEAHLAAVDEEQMRWLWEPGDRERYLAMSLGEQRAHQLGQLQQSHDTFGAGPKWAFSADTVGHRYVAYVDCDLAHHEVPAGGANISYTCAPAHRGNGWTSRSVRLVCAFLREETDAKEAHLLVDVDNAPSRRVAEAVGAREVEQLVNRHGRTMIRYVVALRPSTGSSRHRLIGGTRRP